MRAAPALAFALAAGLLGGTTAGITAAGAQQARERVIDVRPRSFLDAGSSVPIGRYQGYSLGLTPSRGDMGITGLGSSHDRLITQGTGSGIRPIIVDIPAPRGLAR